MGDDIQLSLEKHRDGESFNEVEVRLTSIGRYRHGLREYIAEFWGTFILILFGDGVIAQTVLSNQIHGNQVTINICWGIAVMMGVYTCGGISGAHLNPAVTFTLAVFRKFPRKKVIGYWIAQGCGAYLACAVLYANYIQAFNDHDGGVRTVMGKTGTAGIFSTYPAPFMTVEGAFFEQVLATGILVFGIFAINDMGNTGAGNLGPLMIGLLVVAIGMAFGWQTGYALNPARDLAPRLFAYLIYGSEVFWTGSNYFMNYTWIPVMAPMLGAPIGAFIYDLFMFTGEGPLQRIFQVIN